MKKLFLWLLIVSMIAVFSLAGCRAEAAKEIEEAEEVVVPPVVEETKETQETPPVVEKTPEEIVNVPEILGLTFNQETKSYFNEAGVEVGVYVEDAIEINGKMEDAVGLAPEVIREMINENKEKGIFKFPWFFNPQENKDLKIVELIKVKGRYKRIGIKYTEPINFYAPSDCVYAYRGKYIPQENDPYSSQDSDGAYFSTGFEFENKNGDIVPVDYEIDVVGWKPLVELGQSYFSGPSWELQDFIEEIKVGQLLGQLLPTNPNYSFLDLFNRSDRYENPDQCQASFWPDIFGDRVDVKSDLDRILRLGEKDNEITVFVWSNNQKTAHEQTN